jgi:hypothetical protein
MPLLIEGADAVAAWKNGAQAILSAEDNVVRNLVTEITGPIKAEKDWYARFNPQAVGATDSMSVVAKVLFPARERAPGETRQAYYGSHSARLQRALRMGTLHSSWRGTYFQRLISLDGSDNQVERALRVLSNWNVGVKPPS